LLRFLYVALISAALIPVTRAADSTTKPAMGGAADDGIIRPTISETEQLKLEVQRLKQENALLRKQLQELQNAPASKAPPAPVQKDPPKDSAKKHNPDSIEAALAEGRPALGMTEEALEQMINSKKSAGANKTLESESPAGKVIKYDSSIYTFRVFIESGKVIRIYEVNKNKSAIFEPIN
jgi:hypothetical protein